MSSLDGMHAGYNSRRLKVYYWFQTPQIFLKMVSLKSSIVFKFDDRSRKNKKAKFEHDSSCCYLSYLQGYTVSNMGNISGVI